MDRRKLRAINSNTVYDAPEKTIQLGRRMRKGDMGRVLDVVIAVRRFDENGEQRITTFGFGNGTAGDRVLMVKALESYFIE